MKIARLDNYFLQRHLPAPFNLDQPPHAQAQVPRTRNPTYARSGSPFWNIASLVIMSNQTAPLVSVEVGLNPPNLIESEAMELSVAAVSHAPYPIIILDYSTIFNIQLAQSESRSSGIFHLQDIDTNTELCLQYRRRKERSIRYELGHSDSRYFHTLHPEIPHKFSGQCHASFMELVPGHRYRLSAGEEEKVWWWKKGTKEDYSKGLAVSCWRVHHSPAVIL